MTAMIDLGRLRVAMQTLGDLTHRIDLPTDYGTPVQAYQIGMKALVDHMRFGGHALVVRAARIAGALAEVYEREVGRRGGSARHLDAARDAAAAFLIATARDAP